MDPKRWPNLLTALRIALMPAVLAAAVLGSKPWFVALIAASLSTDALDGFLARRLNAFSEFGRKLDSAADYVTMLTGLAGIALLWPEMVRREWAWIVVGLSAFFLVVVYGLVRLGRAPCYHTWGAKIGAVACACSLVPLLAGWSALPFHAVMVFEVISALEEMTIALLVPRHVGEMPSAWHAWRLRRGLTRPLAPLASERR
jgi:phosphatidylglycerophosphate synthase